MKTSPKQSLAPAQTEVSVHTTSSRPIVSPLAAERLSAIETRLGCHEALCTERNEALRDELRWAIRAVFAVLIGMVAWLAIQLWTAREPVRYPARAASAEEPPRFGVLPAEGGL